MLLRRLDIRARLVGAFMLLGALVLALSLAGWFVAKMQNDSFNRFNTHVVLSMKSADELWVALLTSRILEKDMQLSVGDGARLQDLSRQWDAQQIEAARALADIQARVIDPGSIRQVEAIGQALTSYRNSARPVLDRMVAGAFEEPAQLASDMAAPAKHLDQAQTILLEARGTVGISRAWSPRSSTASMRRSPGPPQAA